MWNIKFKLVTFISTDHKNTVDNYVLHYRNFNCYYAKDSVVPPGSHITRTELYIL